jgi:hypothetical protein
MEEKGYQLLDTRESNWWRRRIEELRSLRVQKLKSQKRGERL